LEKKKKKKNICISEPCSSAPLRNWNFIVYCRDCNTHTLIQCILLVKEKLADKLILSANKIIFITCLWYKVLTYLNIYTSWWCFSPSQLQLLLRNANKIKGIKKKSSDQISYQKPAPRFIRQPQRHLHILIKNKTIASSKQIYKKFINWIWIGNF